MKLQRLLILTFLLLTIAAAAAEAQTKPDTKQAKKTEETASAGILLFGQSSFTLAAPKNWVMDSEAGAGDGLPAVFYPQGSSWKDGKAVMYANVWVKENPQKDTLQTVIDSDVKAFKDRSADLKVTDGEALLTSKSEKKATVKYFTGDAFGNHEAIAYIDEGKTVTMIVLTARTKEDFDKSLAAFKELVSSYFFLTGNVKIEK